MIHYFIGNKYKGIDLTSDLEDISIKRQKRMFEKRYRLPKGRFDNLKEGLMPPPVFDHPNKHAIEGMCEQAIYYLRKNDIKWCAKRSLKGFLIRLTGKNIAR